MPRQSSSGGKPSLGQITKRGDDYLRTLLIQGAKSAHDPRQETQRPHLVMDGELRDRVGWQKAVVAMANKNARILWAVLTKGRPSIPTTCRSTQECRLRPEGRRLSSRTGKFGSPQTCVRRCTPQVRPAAGELGLVSAAPRWRRRYPNGVLLSGLYLGPHR